jgi:hypothetical protein
MTIGYDTAIPDTSGQQVIIDNVSMHANEARLTDIW